MRQLGKGKAFNGQKFFSWVDNYPAQIALMATQVFWSEEVESSLSQGSEAGLNTIRDQLELTLKLLADHIVMPNVPSDRRKKYEQLVTEMVHQRDVTRELIADGIRNSEDYRWLSQVTRYSHFRSADRC